MEYRGLREEEVQQRIEQGEVNVQEERMTRSVRDIILANSVTFFNLINLALFAIVLLTGNIKNGAFIGTVIANTCIGIYQELKAKKLLDGMHLMVESKCMALRDEAWKEIPVHEIVLDDVIRIEMGMQIPADLEVLEGNLEVNESMLTGEADTVEKHVGDHAYGGTVVTSGNCIGKVYRVGKKCISASIMEEARKYKKARSKLHEDLEKLLKIISFAIVPTGIILYLVQKNGIGLVWQEAAIKTVAAMVGMIPEGLVVLTSVALAVSTMRLSRRQALVQDLFSIESLARVDTICLDKTGTLTAGSMAVTDVIPLFGHNEEEITSVMKSYLYGSEKANATQQALIERFGTEAKYAQTSDLPFSSDRKYAGKSLQGMGSYYTGAVNFLFPQGCPAVMHRITPFLEKGERILVLAHSDETEVRKDHVPEDLEPVAMIAIKDVLRDHVQEIIQYFTDEDVTIKVISGDDPATVSSLARQAGIPHADQYVDMSKARLNYEELADQYTVFGRVLPDQKKKLVEAMQANGHTVAMTGDGVNDVPALKKADVSIAMAAGAAAAKDSANIVLLNNDFALMPDILKEGRRVINNISRASSMYLVKTVFSILLSLYVVIMQQSYPFLPIHLTLISTFGVGMPTFVLQMEPSMERVKGRFFSTAFRNAIPSACAVFLASFACLLLRVLLKLSVEENYAIFVSLTGMIYMYTLYRVYQPPTKMRTAVIVSMTILTVAAMLLLKSLLQLHFRWTTFLIIVPCGIGLIFLIQYLSAAYDSVSGWIAKAAKRNK